MDGELHYKFYYIINSIVPGNVSLKFHITTYSYCIWYTVLGNIIQHYDKLPLLDHLKTHSVDIKTNGALFMECLNT